MIAATDGADSNDYFQIIAIQRTNSAAVLFACTNSRVYSLQAVTNMVGGEWLLVDGAVNRQGDASGTMTLTDTNDLFFKAYRVGVRLP